MKAGILPRSKSIAISKFSHSHFVLNIWFNPMPHKYAFLRQPPCLIYTPFDASYTGGLSTKYQSRFTDVNFLPFFPETWSTQTGHPCCVIGYSVEVVFIYFAILGRFNPEFVSEFEEKWMTSFWQLLSGQLPELVWSDLHLFSCFLHHFDRHFLGGRENIGKGK